MTVNGIPPGDKGRLGNNHLEQALEGLDPETRTRALAFVQQLGLSPDDPLFLFSIVLKQFETLVVTAPQQWESTFATFRSDLTLWQDHQSRSLETAERMTDAIEELTRSLNEQTALSSDLLQACESISGQSATTGEPSPELAQKLDHLSSDLEAWIEESRQTMQRLTATLDQNKSAAPAGRPPLGTPPPRPGMPFPPPAPGATQVPPSPHQSSRSLSVLFGVLLCLTGVTCFMVYQLRGACKPGLAPQAHTWIWPKT